MAKSIWKGEISFGLVSIPVSLAKPKGSGLEL
jgi:non-homologous end joining protein Ku